jgi:uncharacterized membrane protein
MITNVSLNIQSKKMSIFYSCFTNFFYEITRISGVNLNPKFYLKKLNLKYFFFQYLKTIVVNQCIRLIKSLTTFAKYRPIEEVQLALVGFISILGNLRSVRQF